MIPYLKRIGFLASDGTPTELYTRFRNPASSGAAAAEALRQIESFRRTQCRRIEQQDVMVFDHSLFD